MAPSEGPRVQAPWSARGKMRRGKGPDRARNRIDIGYEGIVLNPLNNHPPCPQADGHAGKTVHTDRQGPRVQKRRFEQIR